MNKEQKEKLPYPSMLTPSGYTYKCPNCGEEILTNTETFYCNYCGYETEIHIPENG